MRTPYSNSNSVQPYTEQQKAELAQWPVLRPYIHSRKRINIEDGTPTHGTFDIEDTSVREVWICGHLTTTVSTIWLNSERINELPEELQKPWGSYPPIPQRKK